MKYKYVFLQIAIRNGEYEYYCSSVHRTDLLADIFKFADEYAKDYYPGEAESTDEGYYFNAGEVCVWVSSVKEIPKEEYDIISKYL